MRSSKPMAAKCCWSTCCRASARRRWSIARAEARRERGGKGVSASVVVETVARSGRLVDDGGYFRHPDRLFTALVDDVGRDLRGRIPRLDGAVPRRQGFSAIAEAAHIYPADCALCPGCGRNALVERAMW